MSNPGRPYSMLDPFPNGQQVQSPFQNQTASSYTPPSALMQWGAPIWSSVPGRFAQGALIDPALGSAQTAANAVSAVDPNLQSYATFMNTLVNSADQNYNAARGLTGQNPNGADLARMAGGLASLPVLGDEEAASLGSKAVTAAANSILTSPVVTSNGNSYLSGKLDNAGKDSATGTATDYLGGLLGLW